MNNIQDAIKKALLRGDMKKAVAVYFVNKPLSAAGISEDKARG